MKKELNEKKFYLEPLMKVILLDSASILAGSNDGDGNNGNDGDDDNGLGDGYWHEGLI
ncbi:MAG: hypothetical protein MJZ32_11460 [Bacteroidaceae bacterium]|nr:hypothetical protein [Bacteroidaceae bacterium]